MGLHRKIIDSNLFVAFIGRTLLKQLILKNVASIQIQKVAIYDSDHEKNPFNFKQIFQILHLIVIDYFSTHSYKVDIS